LQIVPHKSAMAESPDLRGVARQPRLEVDPATEVLPVHVLSPSSHKFLVAEVEAVLQVQQPGHQPQGQARPARAADAATQLDGLHPK
jgi:hypothetical protein